MKAILILVLVVSAANAFDGFGYYQGFTEKLGFGGSQFQDGINCFITLAQLAGQVNTLLENTQRSEFQSSQGSANFENTTGEVNFSGQGPNFEKLFFSFIGLYGQVRIQIQDECQAIIDDLATVLTPNFTNPSMQDAGEGLTFEEIAAINWNFYFPQIIQQIGTWVNQLVSGQDLEAGQTHAYILQILAGSVAPKLTPETNITLGKSVPFNLQNFMNQFFTGFFRTLGFNSTEITNNVRGLSSCVVDTLPNLAMKVISFQVQTAKLSPLDTLIATKSFVANFVTTFRGCKPALLVLNKLSTNILNQINNAKTNSLYTILLNAALNFPQLDNTIISEAFYIDQGKYDLAGQAEAQRWQTLLKDIVVNFAS